MSMPTFLGAPEPRARLTLYLSTPLYLATLFFSLSAHLLLIFSGDGYEITMDNAIVFPIIVLFVSLMTAPVRCFFWVCSFCLRVEMVRVEERREGQIRLGDEKEEEEEMRKPGLWKVVGDVLLSWNAWVAATLLAALVFTICRFAQNAKGRALLPQAGYGVTFLGISW